MKSSSKLLKTELLISYVLRYGVILCGIVIALGLFARLAHIRISAYSESGLGSVLVPSSQIIHSLRQGQMLPDNPIPQTTHDFMASLAAGQADTVMALGLALLILLPITRVGMTVVLFLFEEDWAFLGITLIVFCVLISGIVMGRAM